VPDEVIQYAAGFYGETVAPIDANVLDMIMAAPRAKEVAGNPPEQPTIEELRRRYGTDDDDELILRALVPGPDIDKMRAAGPVKRDYPLLSSPELDQVARLMKIARSPVVQIRSAKLSLDLSRRAR
jgi:oxaloacetate decarboxylase alpha subunit